MRTKAYLTSLIALLAATSPAWADFPIRDGVLQNDLDADGNAITNLEAGSIGTAAIADDAVTPAKVDETGAYSVGSITATGTVQANAFDGVIDAADIVGTISNANLDADLADLADRSAATLFTFESGISVSGNSLYTGDVELDGELDLTEGSLTLAPGEISNADLASGIDAAKLTTGTLPDARLPSYVPLLDASVNTFTSQLRAGNLVSGNGSTTGFNPANDVAYFQDTGYVQFHMYQQNSAVDGFVSMNQNGNTAYGTGTSEAGMQLWTTSQHPVRLAAHRQQRLEIESDGNYDLILAETDGEVGIATDSPGAKLHVNGTFAITPQSANITADNQAITLTKGKLFLTSDSGTAPDRTFTINNGNTMGDELELHWTDATDLGELLDSGNVALSADWQPALNDTLSLTWNGSVWAETSRSNN